MGRTRFVFPSLAEPHLYGYTLDLGRGLWDSAWRSTEAVSDHAGMFKTEGDGLCQHSSEWAVQSKYFVDYCSSLAVFLLDAAPSLDEEERRAISGYTFWRTPPSGQLIEFFRAVKFKHGGKKLYYNANEKKTSAAESKEHDKRWTAVPEWADGSAQAVYDFLANTERSRYTLERFTIADGVRDHFARVCDDWTPAAAQLTRVCNGKGTWREEERHAQAFGALRNVIEHLRSFESAARSVRCLLDTEAHRKAEAAQERADAAQAAA